MEQSVIVSENEFFENEITKYESELERVDTYINRITNFLSKINHNCTKQSNSNCFFDRLNVECPISEEMKKIFCVKINQVLHTIFEYRQALLENNTSESECNERTHLQMKMEFELRKPIYQ